MKWLSLFFCFLTNITFIYTQDLSEKIPIEKKREFLYMIKADFSWNVKTYRGYCSSKLKLKIYNTTWEDIGEHGLCRGSCIGDIVGFSKTPFVQLQFYSEAISKERFTRWCDWYPCFKYECSGNYKATDYTTQYITYDKYCKTIVLPQIESHASWVNLSSTNWEVQYWLNLKYKIIPLHTLACEKITGTNPNAYLPIGTKVKLFAKEGFPSELYNYQFSKTRTWNSATNAYEYQWENLSQTSKSHILSVSAEDIFGSKLEAEKHIGKKVYFRVVSFDKDQPWQVCSSSAIIPLEVTISAPKIKEFDSVQPLCPEDNGRITLTFDRELYPQESLKMSLLQGEMVHGKFHKGIPVKIYDNKAFRANLKNKKFTITDLPPLTQPHQAYQLQFVGKYHYGKDSIPTFSDGQAFEKTFRIVAIPKLSAEVTKHDNICQGEAKGFIEIKVTGGTPPYKCIKGNDTLSITDNQLILDHLQAGTYSFTIVDQNNCKVFNDSGKPEIFSLTIQEPDAIVIINQKEPTEKNQQPHPLFFKKDVSGFGLKNGEIQAIIDGGTPFEAPSEPYQLTLTTINGTVIPSFSSQTNIKNQFIAHYTALDKGNYTLTITDKNGCKHTQPVFIDEPDPLVVTLSESVPISCNPTNDDPNNDPKLNTDGIIYAHVEGGVKAYRYQWFRIKGGNAEQLLGETQSRLEKCTEGTYRVDITDKNNNQTHGTLSLKFPKRMILSVQADEIRCSDPNSGQARVSVGGGTPPYTYQWSDGQTTATATGLSVGKYFVVVRDSKGCSVQSQVVLSYPQAPQIDNEQITPLVCHGDQNASIVLTTSNGKGKVAHTWYDASGRVLTKGVSKDGKSVKNLAAGSYKIVLRDESDCPSVEKTFQIAQPEKLSLQLPQSVTLCQGDSYVFNLDGQIVGASYRWTDASGKVLGTEASLEVHSAGDYFVEATSPKGCKATAQTHIKQSAEVLEVDFLVATTSYYDYTLKLINLSKKIDALQWQFPDDAWVINQNKQEAEIRFPKEGVYRVGLKGILGECQKVIEKLLFVEKDRVGLQQNTQVQKHIESFLIVPNPNSGNYQLHIKLHKASTIRIRLIDMLGRELFAPEEFSAQTDFILPFNKPNLSAGQYIILVEANGEVLSQKMIVK